MTKVNKNEQVDQVDPNDQFGPVVHKPTDGQKLIADLGGVSKAIRYLDSQGVSRGQIAKILNKRYQHVRNVLITPIKK